MEAHGYLYFSAKKAQSPLSLVLDGKTSLETLLLARICSAASINPPAD
jgi:hypothetical protein